MADPDDTAPTAPTLPVGAPEVTEGSEVGAGAPGAPGGIQAAPRKAGRPKGSQPITAPGSTHPQEGTPTGPLPSSFPKKRRTLARASLDNPRWPEVLADLRRAVPFDVACRCAGIAPTSAEDALLTRPERQAEVDAAKAHGERALLMGDAALGFAAIEPRDRQWRLERLYPKRYHLPTKVHTGQDADAAPMQVAALVVPADPEALRAELRLVQQQIAGLLGPGSDDEGSV